MHNAYRVRLTTKDGLPSRQQVETLLRQAHDRQRPARSIMSGSGVGHIAQKRYKSDITVGALKLPESRRIADLLLRRADADGWKDAIVSKNILQARTPTTARRLTSLIRRRLETMGPDVWILVRDGHGRVATHAIFSAAVKHSPLLGDFLQFVVGEPVPVVPSSTVVHAVHPVPGRLSGA